jgi:hypothetical protein
MNIEKAANRRFRFLGRSLFPDYDSETRLPGRAHSRVAFPRSGPACLCLPRSDDRSHQPGYLGGTHPPGGLDTRGGAAHHHHVGRGSHANSISPAAAGENSAASLLRSQHIAVTEGTYSSCVHLLCSAEYDQVATSLDRPDHRPAKSHSDGSFAASEPHRSASAPSCGRTLSRCQRSPPA